MTMVRAARELWNPMEAQEMSMDVAQRRVPARASIEGNGPKNCARAGGVWHSRGGERGN